MVDNDLCSPLFVTKQQNKIDRPGLTNILVYSEENILTKRKVGGEEAWSCG